jgi:hypothetical protein
VFTVPHTTLSNAIKTGHKATRSCAIFELPFSVQLLQIGSYCLQSPLLRLPAGRALFVQKWLM